MTQRDRDRLVTKARKGLITQRQAAAELGQSERHIRRLLKRLVHALRGRESNRKLDQKTKQEALEILSQEVYRGFGPRLAADHFIAVRMAVCGSHAIAGATRMARGTVVGRDAAVRDQPAKPLARQVEFLDVALV
jgi:hypothetical protein